MKYDIIIIGSGIAGLYAAYNIKKTSPNTSFLILEKNKKKYTFRININGKPKVSVFVDSPDISEKEAKNLFANWRNSTSGQGVIGPEGAKVEFQAVDTASDKVLNSYKMDVARDPHYAGWGHSSTHGTV